MMLDAAVRVAADPIEHVDDRTDLDVEAGFFLHFAGDGLLEGFAQLDPAARQAPLPFQRLVRAFDEQHAIAVEDHGPDADDRPWRIRPHDAAPRTRRARTCKPRFLIVTSIECISRDDAGGQ